MKRRPVTLRDVAREVSMSPSTVSRALAGGAPVHPETLERIRDAAERLGYVGNASAHSLSTGRTGTIGLVVPDLRNPFFSEIAKGAQRRARAAGYAVFLTDTDHDPSLEIGAVEAMRGDVEGIILCAPEAPDDVLREQLAGLPALVMFRRVGGVPALLADHGVGVQQAVEHLQAMGHTRIAHVAGPATSWDAAARRQAFESFCDGPVVGPVQDRFEAGVAVADAVLSTGATAVITTSDLVALGVAARLYRRGVAVPEDFSLVGIDGIEMAAMAPALSTVSVPRMSAAQRAVSLLNDLLRAPDSDSVTTLPTQFLLRESTGPVPRRPL